MATKKKTAPIEPIKAEPIKAEPIKAEPKFTKSQIIGAEKYKYRTDICKAVLPEDFHGTIAEADEIIEKYMKGKVN